MRPFIQHHQDHVTGVLSGFDRLVLRGSLRTLAYTGGMMNFLYEVGVLLKEFGGYVERTTKHLRTACYEKARQLERPVIYLPSSQPSKEAQARQIATRDGVSEGLICLLSCVEPCLSYEIRATGNSSGWCWSRGGGSVCTVLARGHGERPAGSDHLIESVRASLTLSSSTCALRSWCCVSAQSIDSAS